MNEIDDLVRALERIGSPFLQTRRPGLSRDELHAEAFQHLPEPWADYIDEEICAWYSWQNGVDPDTAKAGGEAWQGSHVITPDGLALQGIHEILLHGWDVAGPEYPPYLGIVFPLGHMDSSGGDFFAYKSDLEADWTVSYHWLESGLQPLRMRAGHTKPPTLREYVAAIAAAITGERLVLGRYGNVTIPGEGIKRTNDHYYPWQG